MTSVRFEIPGPPVPKSRARVTRTNTYQPKKTAEYERSGKWAAHIAMGRRRPTFGPVAVQVFAYMPIPASWSVLKRSYAIGSKHYKRPDLDNIVKMALDICNGIVFHDDGQVSVIFSSKYYSEDPRLEVEVSDVTA